MKGTILRSVFIAWLCCVCSMSMAAAPVEQRLSDLLQSLKTLRADFTQTVYDNHHKVVQKSFGHMALARPGEFRWEVTQPIPQLIIARQTRLWIYDKDLEQLTIRSLDESNGSTPALLLSHDTALLTKDFNVQSVSGEPSQWQWFLLTPKQNDGMFVAIKMGFDGKSIRVMQLKDHMGHDTLIQFEAAKVNTTLSPSLFHFKAPPHVDVIDESARHV